MAEPTTSEMKQMAEIFAEAYNEANGTSFSWDDSRSYQANQSLWYDFQLFEGKRTLEVQHVRATGDFDREFVRPERVRATISELRKELEYRKLPPLSIYLNFVHPPENDEEIDDAVFWLEHLIDIKSEETRTSYFSYHSSIDDQFLSKLKKYVNNLEIAPRRDGKGAILFAYSASRDFPEPSLDDEQKVSIAVRKKEYKAQGVILMVEAGNSPIDDVYIPLIKESLAESKLQEIWVVNNFLSRRGAIRVK